MIEIKAVQSATCLKIMLGGNQGHAPCKTAFTPINPVLRTAVKLYRGGGTGIMLRCILPASVVDDITQCKQ